MAKELPAPGSREGRGTKPSDRGRNVPDAGPGPGNRAEQRDTEEQLREHDGEGADQPLGWQWSEQENLPPRGQGSQHNQGEAKQTTLAERGRTDERQPAEGPVASGATPPGLHTGGTRGPSNQNNKS